VLPSAARTFDGMIFEILISVTYDNYKLQTKPMKIKIAPLLVLLFFLSSCAKENLGDPDYFAFGNAYGMCLGNCANFFLIKDKSIFPDDMDNYMGMSLKFKSEILPDEKYILAQKLIENFPEYLIKNPDKTFGCPDCADQGGIHIEIQDKGVIKRWHFDTTNSNLPAEIRDYVKEISAVIEQLK
jgi:hypothetical protein